MESKKRNFNVKICTLYHMNIITVQTLCDLAFKLVTAARICILLTKERFIIRSNRLMRKFMRFKRFKVEMFRAQFYKFIVSRQKKGEQKIQTEQFG